MARRNPRAHAWLLRLLNEHLDAADALPQGCADFYRNFVSLVHALASAPQVAFLGTLGSTGACIMLLHSLEGCPIIYLALSAAPVISLLSYSDLQAVLQPATGAALHLIYDRAPVLFCSRHSTAA